MPWVGRQSVIVSFPGGSVGGPAVCDCVTFSWCRGLDDCLLLGRFLVVPWVGLQSVIVSLSRGAVDGYAVCDCASSRGAVSGCSVC